MESYQISFTINNKNVSEFVYVCLCHILFAALVLVEILVNFREEIISLKILNFQNFPGTAFFKSLRPTLLFSLLLDIWKNYKPLTISAAPIIWHLIVRSNYFKLFSELCNFIVRCYQSYFWFTSFKSRRRRRHDWRYCFIIHYLLTTSCIS